MQTVSPPHPATWAPPGQNVAPGGPPDTTGTPPHRGRRPRNGDTVPAGVRLVAALAGFVLIVGGSVLLVHRHRSASEPAGLLDPVSQTEEEALDVPLQLLLARPAAGAVAPGALSALPAHLSDTVPPLADSLAAYPAGGRLAPAVASLSGALGAYSDAARRLLDCVDAAGACAVTQADAEKAAQEVDRLAGDLRLYIEG